MDKLKQLQDMLADLKTMHREELKRLDGKILGLQMFPRPL
jgi:hypothetical protein